ncbi:hypothetical protein [Aureisphaera sp.]
MKNLFLTLLLLPLVSFTANIQYDLIGEWEGEDQGEIGLIVFQKNGFAYFEVAGQRYGGEEFELDGKKGSMKYKINSNVDPVEVDFVVTKHETKEQRSLLGILKFTDEDSMTLAIGFNGPRPTGFDSENSIRLNRIE